MKENLAGHLFISETRYGPLVHARLESPGELGKLVAQKTAGPALPRAKPDCIISDGPPALRPVISSLSK